MKLWTDEDQRLATRAMAREEVCTCEHLKSKHGQMGACFATVWIAKIRYGVEEGFARYCPCLEYEAE